MNQLKTEYKRDFKNNYMLISFEEEEEADIEKYEFKMLENNYISGLMKFKLVKDFAMILPQSNHFQEYLSINR